MRASETRWTKILLFLGIVQGYRGGCGLALASAFTSKARQDVAWYFIRTSLLHERSNLLTITKLVVQYFSGNKTWRCTVGKNNIDGIPRAYYHMTQLEGSEQSKGLLHVPGCIPLKIHYLRRKRQLQGASMRKLLFLSQSTNVLCSDT